MTLTANDQAGLSGVDATYYTLNGGLPQAYTTPFTLTDDGATTLEFWSVDHAGNVEVAKTETVRIDKTVPTALCDPIPTGWSNENVTLNCVASDTGGSELSDPNPAAFSLSTNVPAGSEDANASTGTMALSDGAGNPGTAGPYTGIRVDRRAPTGVAFVNAPSRVTQGSVFPTVGCTAEDDGSDLASCTVTGQNTSDLGDRTLTATAVDNVGNQSTATHTYTVEAPAPSCTVAAEFHGAVKPAMRNQVQAGRVVPVQIAVTCGGAAATGLTPAIRLLSGDQAEDASFASPATTTQTVSSADTGGEMRPNSTGYIYNLQMPPTAKAGDTFTIAVRPRTGDQSLTALVQIRK